MGGGRKRAGLEASRSRHQLGDLYEYGSAGSGRGRGCRRMGQVLALVAVMLQSNRPCYKDWMTAELEFIMIDWCAAIEMG